MHRLIVNPDTDQAWEIPLLEGFVELGRDPATGHAIEHPSVSEAHCQVVVAGGEVQVQDLGSAQGTFVDGLRVEQAALKPGQTLRLGEVELRLIADSSTSLPPPIPGLAEPAIAPTDAGTGKHCRYHPKASATWICHDCRADYCGLCVSQRKVGDHAPHFCRKCGNECVPVPRWIPNSPQEQPSFYKLLPGAFRYPLQGNGLILLVTGTLFFAFFGLAQMLTGFLGPYGGIGAGIIGILMAGYLFNYAKCAVTSTAAGDAEPPDWPDFSDWKEDMLMPFGQLLALAALTFGPAAILRWWQPGGETWGPVAALTAAVFGALLAPMGLLALAMLDSVAVLNPVSLIWSILRIPLPYLVAAAAFELVALAWFGAGDWVAVLLPVPLLPGLISGFLNLYLMLVGTRMLGLLYRTNQERLGWV